MSHARETPRCLHYTVFTKSFQQMEDSCQTDWNFWQDKIKFSRTGGLSVIKLLSFVLPDITGHLSDKLKFYAGQNENLPVLSDSPAVFTKTALYSYIPWSRNLLQVITPILFEIIWSYFVGMKSWHVSCRRDNSHFILYLPWSRKCTHPCALHNWYP